MIIKILSKKQRKTTKKVGEKHQNLLKEENQKKPMYGCHQYKNPAEDEKQNLVDYRKKYFKMRKNALL